jgi:hypothetical protein
LLTADQDYITNPANSQNGKPPKGKLTHLNISILRKNPKSQNSQLLPARLSAKAYFCYVLTYSFWTRGQFS